MTSPNIKAITGINLEGVQGQSTGFIGEVEYLHHNDCDLWETLTGRIERCDIRMYLSVGGRSVATLAKDVESTMMKRKPVMTGESREYCHVRSFAVGGLSVTGHG